MQVRRAVMIGVICAGVVAMAVGPPLRAQSLQAPGGASGGAPALFFPEKAFEFHPVVEGAKVVHDFVVMNQGTAALIIDNVRTG